MSQDDRFGTEPKKTREQIESEIAQTRSALSDDLAALGEKLSADNLKEGAKGVIEEVKHAAKDSILEAKNAAVGTLRGAADAAVGSLREAKDHAFEAVTETAHEIGVRAQRAGYATSTFVTTHAVPLSLLGIGLGWLMLSMNHAKRREQQRYLYDRSYDRELGYGYEGAARSSFGVERDWGHSQELRGGGLADTARGYAQSARSRAGELTERAAQGIDDTRAQVRETAMAARSRVGETMDSARARVGETLESARNRVDGLRSQASELGHDLGARASDMSHQAYAQLQRAGNRTREFTEENPLAVGALAVVAGVGVGLMLPSTRRENQLLGEARDRLWNDAQHAASRVTEGVQRTAGELRGALTSSEQR